MIPQKVQATAKRNDNGTAPATGGIAVCAKDIYEVPRLAIQGALAWTLPEIVWSPLSRAFGRVNALMHPRRTREETAAIAAVLDGAREKTAARQIAIENWANRYEERFQYLRAWRPGGWNPQIEIIGAEHVSKAKAIGRGIIFWGSNFSFNDLVTKMAWHRLALKVKHFSRPAHGFSTTRFGIRYLNAVRRGIEDQYLDERLMTPEDQTRAAMQRLGEWLNTNEVVSLTVGNRGRHKESAAFFGRRMVLATGPLALARSTGAALLPVFTLRLSPARFEVAIGAAIEIPTRADGSLDYAVAVQVYADRLAPYVLRAPGQWKGWLLAGGD